MKRFPVGAPTTQRLISFIQREEEAPRQTASSTQVVSIRLCPRGTWSIPLEPPHKRKALMCDSRSLKTLKQRVQALPLSLHSGSIANVVCDSGPNSRREFRVFMVVAIVIALQLSDKLHRVERELERQKGPRRDRPTLWRVK